MKIAVAVAKVSWANEAFDDLLQLEEFLGGAAKADPTVSGIIARARQLEQFPLSGAVQPTKMRQEYQYLVYKFYKIIYRYEKDVVTIRAVFDTRQDPGKLKL